MTERTDFIAKSHEKRRGRRPADRQQPIDSFWRDFANVTLWDVIGPSLSLAALGVLGVLWLLGVPTVVLLVIVGLVLGVRYWRTVLDFFL